MSGEGPAPALSLVVPVYNEEENVGALHAELGRIAGELACPYEIVFVNDGSRDGTLARLEALAAADPHLHIVDLDGNFGGPRRSRRASRMRAPRSSSRSTATDRT